MDRNEHLKYVSLMTLVVQNSALVLVMRYSRMIPGPRYLASTAVFLSELIKLIVSVVVHIQGSSKIQRVTLPSLYNDLFGPRSDAFKMMVPAVLYIIQNNLQYLAVTLLDAATFQVTYQMKIITTAIFSVLMLGKTLNRTKWTALVLLTLGIALVQLPTSSPAGMTKSRKTVKISTEPSGFFEGYGFDEKSLEKLLGLLAVTVACVLSGLAGVWFEKVLKGSKPSLWSRNVQLAFFSALPGFFIGVLWMDGEQVRENGFFHGYNSWTFGAIACQAIGGLIVAVVVKYADNILKGFATSLSIILSCLASVILFDFVITTPFVIGAGLVIYATYLYGLPDTPTAGGYSRLTPSDVIVLGPDLEVVHDGGEGSHGSAHQILLAVQQPHSLRMSFLFKSKSKTPQELVKSTRDALTKIDADRKKSNEEISRNLVFIKAILYGDGESEPVPELVAQLSQEVYNSDILTQLISNISKFDFEAKKDVAQIFNNLLRRQIGSRLPTVEYLCTKEEILVALIHGYENQDIALSCGMILRECIRHEALAKLVLESSHFWCFFSYVELSTFDVASDAFATFKDVLTRHKPMVAEFLTRKYDEFFAKYTVLLNSSNYVTKRQSLKLLGELLLDRSNFNVMTKYIANTENLKLMMNLLRDKSRNIQFEAFHVFKVFVANPNKARPIADILAKNKEKLVQFLSSFHNDRTDDEQFNDEKAFLIKQIQDM
ncbi:hypothetical protein SeLEV6574_g00453 [Synchytrium endobioticum]|uniref:Uncharacterized protein n=1 Tax=Synchytrium endobioticum TaxID=286115 RepID=A0A507DHK2_9FUNG|nr:hypothetical protein SeLEV6574_g00453 [Synchytrium endobioticum]